MNNQPASLESFQAAAEELKNRTVYTFTVPPKLVKATGITTIGIVALTGQEIIDATNASAGNQIRVAFEMAKKSVVEIDGKRLPVDDEDVFWSKPKNAKLRTLVMSGYAEVNQPKDDDVASFLGSVEVRVG